MGPDEIGDDSASEPAKWSHQHRAGEPAFNIGIFIASRRPISIFVFNLHSKTARKQKLNALYGFVCDHSGGQVWACFAIELGGGEERKNLPAASTTFENILRAGSKKEGTLEKRRFESIYRAMGAN